MPPIGRSAGLEKCLTTECRSNASHKGLCLKCWGKAKKMIESGKTTLEELKELGMVKGDPSAFEQELEKRRQSQHDLNDTN